MATPAASTSSASWLPRMRCLGRRRPEIERLRSEMARPCAPVGFTRRAVRPRGRCGTDLDAEIVLFGDRLLNVRESQHVRRPIPVVDHRSHAFP